MIGVHQSMDPKHATKYVTRTLMSFHMQKKSHTYNVIKQRGKVGRHVTMVALFLDDKKLNDHGGGKENSKK